MNYNRRILPILCIYRSFDLYLHKEICIWRRLILQSVPLLIETDAASSNDEVYRSLLCG